MINNLDILLPLLDFSNPDDGFYYIQILQRKKDLGKGPSSKVIKSYAVHNEAYLLDHMDEIIGLCEFFHARAYLYPTRRSLRSVAFDIQKALVERARSNQFVGVHSVYQDCVGDKGVCLKPKIWVIDVDEPNIPHLQDIREVIYDSAPSGSKILAEVPSRTGVHLLTEPFNPMALQKAFPSPNLDIQKNNGTNLIII